jgi:hypothetical protein
MLQQSRADAHFLSGCRHAARQRALPCLVLGPLRQTFGGSVLSICLCLPKCKFPNRTHTSHTYTPTYMSTHVHTHTHRYEHTQICTYTPARRHTHTCMLTHTLACTSYTRMYTRAGCAGRGHGHNISGQSGQCPAGLLQPRRAKSGRVTSSCHALRLTWLRKRCAYVCVCECVLVRVCACVYMCVSSLDWRY